MENGKSRLQQAQDDVEDVKHIMLDNMNKAKEREGKLSELDDRAEDLLEKVRTAQGNNTHVTPPCFSQQLLFVLFVKG